MPYENISIELKENVVQEILQLIQQIEAKLTFLINLTPEERHALPKMGDKSVSFVQKALELAQQYPTLVPPYMDVDELRRDFKLAENLRTIFNALSVLYEKISDTYLAAGSEAYLAALSFYNSAKQAAKQNIPGTDYVVNELGKRFERKPYKSQETSKPEQ